MTPPAATADPGFASGRCGRLAASARSRARGATDGPSGVLPRAAPARSLVVGRRRRVAGADAGAAAVAAVIEACGALRAGARPPDAWRRAGIHTEDGIPVESDLERLGATPAQVTAVLGAARLAAEVGAPPAPVLDQVIAGAVAEEDARTQREAAMAGPRATARLLAWLPVLGLVLGVGLGAEPWGVLLDGRAGTAMGAVGLGLMWVGHRWTRRALAVAESAGDAAVPGGDPREPHRAPHRAQHPRAREDRRARVSGRALGARVGRRDDHRARRADRGDEAGVTLVLDLLGAACAAGVGLPRALQSVGAAAGGRRGAALRRAGRALVLGAHWDDVWDGSPDLAPVARAVRSAWQDGIPAVPALRDAADRHRRERQAAALEEAGRLGVRLVVPLGLCHLPAFVLIGLVPVLVSMASGLG